MLKLFARRKPKFYTWTNPDGSSGGQVSRLAHLHPGVTVDTFGIVLSGTTLADGTHIRDGEIVDGDQILGPIRSDHGGLVIKGRRLG